MTKSIGMIVAGEVGATETRLALCGLDVGRPIVLVEETADNGQFAGLTPMVQGFLRKYRPPQIRAAAFVMGGPVYGGASFAAEVPWAIGAQSLASELGVEKVTILTEAEGIAHAIPALAHEDIVPIWGNDSGEDANQVVVSLGTSPGVAGRYWDGTEHRSFASDAGHADFAPGSEEERRLALHLSARSTRVTVGLLLSRAGLELIDQFVRGAETPPTQAPLTGGDPVAAIIRGASAGKDPVCRRTVDLFFSTCGSIAGNLALTLRATGGVFLAGDLVPSLQPLLVSLASGALEAAFGRKAPLEQSLRTIPVQAILSPRASLLGAATVAARALRTQRGGGWAS
jgi:glucokinase